MFPKAIKAVFLFGLAVFFPVQLAHSDDVLPIKVKALNDYLITFSTAAALQSG